MINYITNVITPLLSAWALFTCACLCVKFLIPVLHSFSVSYSSQTHRAVWHEGMAIMAGILFTSKPDSWPPSKWEAKRGALFIDCGWGLALPCGTGQPPATMNPQ